MACAALCAAGYDLRGMHFGESLTGQKLTESAYNAFLNFEFCTFADIS